MSEWIYRVWTQVSTYITSLVEERANTPSSDVGDYNNPDMPGRQQAMPRDAVLDNASASPTNRPAVRPPKRVPTLLAQPSRTPSRPQTSALSGPGGTKRYTRAPISNESSEDEDGDRDLLLEGLVPRGAPTVQQAGTRALSKPPPKNTKG